jgi:hypothetical protein
MRLYSSGGNGRFPASTTAIVVPGLEGAPIGYGVAMLHAIACLIRHLPTHDVLSLSHTLSLAWRGSGSSIWGGAQMWGGGRRVRSNSANTVAAGRGG